MITTTNENRYYWLYKYNLAWIYNNSSTINILTQYKEGVKEILYVCTLHASVKFKKASFESFIVYIEGRCKYISNLI